MRTAHADPQVFVHEIADSVDRFSRAKTPQDDLTLVCVRRNRQ
jgi:serine phosphatase RsbU (regulator of sigma subunit)